MLISVNNGGQATLTISGTNIQIPLGPSAAQNQTQNQNQTTTQQNVQNSNSSAQNSTQSNVSSQQNTSNSTQNQSNTQQNQNNSNQQQQGTIFTIPTASTNTIQIPANFAGKLRIFICKIINFFGAWTFFFVHKCYLISILIIS